jgi:short-subunit dehydrogenase
MELDGAQVAVTGGSGGIGSALGAAFQRAGCSVLSLDLPGRGADLTVDITDRAEAAATFASLNELDVVIANAGVGVAGLAAEIDASDWDQAIEVNIRGTVNTLLAALPLLRKKGRGSIVIMSSLSGLLATPLLTPYAMTKHALLGLGASIRPELAIEGIGVTVVCPGPVDTSLLDEPSRLSGMSVRRYLTAAAGRPITPAKLADAVVDGVRRNKALVIPRRAAVLWRLQRFLPTATAWQLSRNMSREIQMSDGNGTFHRNTRH